MATKSTTTLVRSRLRSWKQEEQELTRLVADIRSDWPDPEDALCDRLLDRLDHLDEVLDGIRAISEQILSDIRSLVSDRFA